VVGTPGDGLEHGDRLVDPVDAGPGLLAGLLGLLGGLHESRFDLFDACHYQGIPSCRSAEGPTHTGPPRT
jgi:hypothetical protein